MTEHSPVQAPPVSLAPPPPQMAPPQVAPPPRGPGVIPPFPAPPTEGRRLRIGRGLGIGAAVLVLACVGGVGAVVGLVRVVNNALNEQARVVVGNYLDDVRAERYSDAYDALCDTTRSTISEAQFTSEQQAGEPIKTFAVGDINLTDVDLAVPVDVTFENGDTRQLSAYLGQDQDTGQFQVCSVEE